MAPTLPAAEMPRRSVQRFQKPLAPNSSPLSRTYQRPVRQHALPVLHQLPCSRNMPDAGQAQRRGQETL